MIPERLGFVYNYGMAVAGFQKISLLEIPKDATGAVATDLYVYLPSSDRYVRFVCSGDEFDEARAAALSKHVIPDLFVLESGAAAPDDPLDQSRRPPADFRVEVIGKDAEEELKQIFKSFLDPGEPPVQVLAKIEAQADQIISIIAPDTKDLKGHLMKNIKYLMLMNDVSAITALAILFAMASGYDSKKSYRDLAYACLVMDSALAEIPEEQIKQYYRDSSKLAPDVMARIRKHPVKSHELAAEKLKSLSDVSMQLILCHHELYSGKGYPRGIRTESLFPMVKVLAFAVDVFERMKKAELNKDPVLLTETILECREPNAEPHLRRHSKKLVDAVLTYLEIHPSLVSNEG